MPKIFIHTDLSRKISKIDAIIKRFEDVGENIEQKIDIQISEKYV